MSLTSLSFSRDRNKYGRIWFILQKKKYTSINRIATEEREYPLRKLIDRLHIPPYLFLSRETDDDVKDIGKHDFPSVLPHPTLSNAIRSSLDMRIRNWPCGRCSASTTTTTSALLKREAHYNLTFLVFIFALNFCSKQDVFLSQQKPPLVLLCVC